MKSESVVTNWASLKDAFSEDFQQRIEQEWNKPFAEVYGFLTSRSRRQLAYIAEAGKATELLCFHISQITEEQS